MNGESPDTGKAQERVTFFTTSLNYTIQVEEEYYKQAGRQMIQFPARLVKFEGGHFTTDDEKLIDLIRGSKPYRRGKITEEAKAEVIAQETHRGAITSATVRKEAHVEEKAPGMVMAEKGARACPDCDYVATDDFSGRKLQGHRMGKHRKGMRPNPKAPSKEFAEELTEAKKGIKVEK